MTGSDTIFALSSGTPPAAIAIIRVSGPAAEATIVALAGRPVSARRASLRWFRHPETGDRIDHGLILWFPGRKTATGEPLAEFHVHGGRAVVDAMFGALASVTGVRAARAGEFTRRAFANGALDLAEAEGLADLLAAETQDQRRNALRLADGALSRLIERWREEVLRLAAMVEAILDFGDEDDVGQDWSHVAPDALRVRDEIRQLLAIRSGERLRHGVRVVVAGPVNAGKSTLFNRIIGRDAAITSAQPGTTRDLIEVSIVLDGVALLLIDTAGVREGEDEVEVIGIERAHRAIAGADIVLWFGEPGEAPDGDVIQVRAKIDQVETPFCPVGAIPVSALTGAGIAELCVEIGLRARSKLPAADQVAINARQREALAECEDALTDVAGSMNELVIVAEFLRYARLALDRITGRAGVEDMLDGLFGRFCIGK